MFGRHLKEENASLRTRLAAAEARCQELERGLEQSRTREEAAQVHTNDHYAEQQQRFRALWFSGSGAVTDIREHLAASAGLLMDERQVLDSAQAVFQHSAQTLAQMEAALKAIASDAEQNCEHITNLHSTAAEISKFVGVISEISEQTNLLALNAAIEAARAGDQGRGFAVVADEVRALAKKANEASAEITRLVGNISQRTTVANSDIRGMAEQSQQLVSSTHQVSEAVTEVVGLSRRMHGVVGRSAADSFIQTVKLDHVVWKSEVYQALLGLSSQPLESFADHTQCRLGKWYREGEGRQLHADHDAFRQLDAPHRGVHEHGIAALKRMQADDCDGALEELALMEQNSARVIELLSRLGDAIIRRQGHS